MYSRVQQVLALLCGFPPCCDNALPRNPALNITMSFTNGSRYDKRQAIVTLYNIGQKPAEIYRYTGYPKTTIRNVIEKYLKRGHTYDAPRSGRPPTLSTWDKKRMIKAVEQNPASSLRGIAGSARLNCSASTVDKALREAKYTLHAKRPKLWLRPGHPMQRLEWCNRRRHWKKDEWRKRVWTDESKIECDPNPVGQKVRYQPGQQLNEKHLKPTFKSSRPNIHVW